MIYEDFSHWTEFEFCLENVCRQGYEKAKKFQTPQSAWDAWDDAGEMLWCLAKRRYDKYRLVRCGMVFVQPILPILNESCPRTELFVQAMGAVRNWWKNPTSDNKTRVASFLRRMKDALEGKRIPYNAANCIFKLGQCIFRRRVITELSLEVAFALIYAAKCRPPEVGQPRFQRSRRLVRQGGSRTRLPGRTTLLKIDAARFSRAPSSWRGFSLFARQGLCFVVCDVLSAPTALNSNRRFAPCFGSISALCVRLIN